MSDEFYGFDDPDFDVSEGPSKKTAIWNNGRGRWEVWLDDRMLSTHSSAADVEAVHGFSPGEQWL